MPKTLGPSDLSFSLSFFFSWTYSLNHSKESCEEMYVRIKKRWEEEKKQETLIFCKNRRRKKSKVLKDILCYVIKIQRYGFQISCMPFSIFCIYIPLKVTDTLAMVAFFVWVNIQYLYNQRYNQGRGDMWTNKPYFLLNIFFNRIFRSVAKYKDR